MKIDIRSDSSLYIKLNGWTYYIDDSTNEQIMEKFNGTPIEIQCPHCDQTLTVYHMDWSAIVCLHCNEEINKEEIGSWTMM
jgi:ribosomal protein S27E